MSIWLVWPAFRRISFPVCFCWIGPQETSREIWRAELKQQPYYFSHMESQGSCFYCTLLLLCSPWWLGQHPGLQGSTTPCFFLRFPWLLNQLCARLRDKECQFLLQDTLHQGWRWWVTDTASCPILWVSAHAHGFYLLLTLPNFTTVFPSLAQVSARASYYIQIGRF